MIKKRNGSLVPFDKERIYKAIEKAMLETQDNNEQLNNRITQSINSGYVEQLKLNKDYTLSVEDIQDFIEEKLMNSNRKDVAKKYILYRENRNKIRANKPSNPQNKLLSDEFLSKYKHLKPPMSPLGEFVYYRTYSRWLEDEKRREFWWETCARVIEFNCGLVENTSIEEAEELFDNMFNLKQFLSGRSLWSGGISTSYSNPASQFNCSYTNIDSFDKYKEICYLLMLGVGVGFSVEKKYINTLPKIRSNIQVIQKAYNPVPKSKRKEITEYVLNKDVMEIIVGDSKIGWSQAIDYLLKAFYLIDFANVKMVIINYDNVRPLGEPLKTFGGKASGHDALKIILEKMYKILTLNKDKKVKTKLRPIDCMDLANIIAEGIVVGGK